MRKKVAHLIIFALVLTAPITLYVSRVLLRKESAQRVSLAGERIVQHPIPFGKLRQRLTLEYIRLHYDPSAQDISIVPQMIVLHWTNSATLRSALSEFDPPIVSGRSSMLEAEGRVNVSAQFILDRDGTTYQLMPANWMARHTIGLNRVAIGIENVGGTDWPLTIAQADADARLIRQLVNRFPNIRYLIGHYEYLNFRETALWQERDRSYFLEKSDPGRDFMAHVRREVIDLNLLDHYVMVDASVAPP
jgi:N-acetylmuramoyl-L-alanine amidase